MDLLNDERKITVGDRLVYQVVEEREPGKIVFVDDRGNVRIPLMGTVPAEGKTCKELAYMIKEDLEEDFFHRATVLIRYEAAENSRGKVNLVGQVARPGPLDIPVDEVMTVSSAITKSGGVLPGADLKNVTVKRSNPDNPDEVQEIVVNVEDVLKNGNLNADEVVKAEDIILVPKRDSASGTYYVTGSVNNPGIYQLPEDGTEFTLSQAILKAGGFTKYANQENVLVISGDPEDPTKQERKTINVRDILEEGKRGNDVVLKPDDIIRVKEVMFAF